MVMPYLHFDGNCEEAFLWYAEVFGGYIQHMAKYGDIPEDPAAPMDAAQKRKVMHAQVMLGVNGGLSGADALWPVETSGAVSIHAHLEEEALARKVFVMLSEGGSILGELAANPPPDDSGISGSVRDRYGFTWIISAMKE